ncbi:hypothetical protein HOK68_03165 [Candidatus Woesearchaeota archaeon]|jgi:hypothetical protein|nr:hypothetical protein [Candidatus Woesearchaeota archaeon]MBT4387561.1 hypothetical protein [Candidatus Woesearchaeota archaeon]MBT4595403.1 hypothetical protein [Candidatus Woesearchaeota archaeon]MBT5741192.1 hypothetical protein [Candidatus Woesearchaeota archaeon]MBT6505754.1 hypothetical protein [Candidatus Woesearchaeota archaeon]
MYIFNSNYKFSQLHFRSLGSENIEKKISVISDVSWLNIFGDSFNGLDYFANRERSSYDLNEFENHKGESCGLGDVIISPFKTDLPDLSLKLTTRETESFDFKISYLDYRKLLFFSDSNVLLDLVLKPVISYIFQNDVLAVLYDRRVELLNKLDKLELGFKETEKINNFESSSEYWIRDLSSKSFIRCGGDKPFNDF